MCGIYGELSLRPGRPLGGYGEQATDLLTHRGPDARGSWCGEGVFLGVRRLSIIDPPGGEQPMWSADGRLCVVYNGETYNYLELRRELQARGHQFRTASDTEVVAQSFQEWGADCLQRLNGMFAIAVWDERERTLLLARDRIGEKPLYLYRDAERLVFASEIKAILADPSIPRRVSAEGLANYLAFGHAVAPHTIYAGIDKLLPGHFLRSRHGRTEIARYWDLAGVAEARAGTRDDREYAERVLALLEDSVRRRMLSDRPVGAFLSGGIDSSAVVALMARHSRAPVRTFSVGFHGDRLANELPAAGRVAALLHTEHEEVTFAPSDALATLPALALHFDEPFADPAAAPLLILSRLATDSVKVVLTGDGGDELFGGYRRYVAEQAAPLYQRLPARLRQRWIPWASERLPRARRLVRAAGALDIADPVIRYLRWLEVLSPELVQELLVPNMAALVEGLDLAGTYRRHYAGGGGGEHAAHLNRLMYVDVNTWLADTYMEKTDKTTMACGLEARMPLLDHRLAELAFEIPATFKVRGVRTKRVLRQAVQGLVPDSVLRQRKRGFTVPIERWLRSELYDSAREILLDGTAVGSYFNRSVVARMLEEHRSGRRSHGSALWMLLNFEFWHRAVPPGSPV